MVVLVDGLASRLRQEENHHTVLKIKNEISPKIVYNILIPHNQFQAFTLKLETSIPKLKHT